MTDLLNNHRQWLEGRVTATLRQSSALVHKTRIVRNVEVKAPIERVFETVSNPEEFLGFGGPVSQDIKVERVTKGPLAKGTTWLFRAKLWGKELEWNTQVTDWDPPNRSVSEQTGFGPFKSARWEHKIAHSDRNKGAVKYTLTVKYELSDWLEKRQTEVENLLGKMYSEIAKGIKHHLEAS